MKYYVYFDGYGHPKQAISEDELTEKYGKNPNEFLKAMCAPERDGKIEYTTGHVGTMSFDDPEELNDFLESLGDEIEGFYGCHSESRPYNF